MKAVILSYGLAALAMCGMPVARGQRPLPAMPPGARSGDVLPIPDIPNIRRLRPEELKREADLLAVLAEAVRSEIDQVNKGTLPKDLGPNLQRMEKLLKQLRAGIAP